jgi:hypothetical protein
MPEEIVVTPCHPCAERDTEEAKGVKAAVSAVPV